jgi:hypothetical protein
MALYFLYNIVKGVIMKMYIIKYYSKSSQTYHWLENIHQSELDNKIMSLHTGLNILLTDIVVYEAKAVKLKIKAT